MPKKSIKKKKVETTKSRKPNRYNVIQIILKNYSKEAGIKLGNESTRVASKLNKLTANQPLKYVEQNIAQLYAEYFEKPAIVKDFPSGNDNFPFYKLEENMLLPIFDDVIVSYTFEDNVEKFEFTGTPQEVTEYFKEGTYRHCRTYYDSSPPASFVIVATDNKTFVKYKLETHYEAKKPEKNEHKTPPAEDKGKSGGNGTLAEQIELERLKNEGKNLDIQKIDKILKLLDAGYTKAEVDKILNGK